MQSFTIEEFKKIHQAWKESGLSVRDYCANTGIKESRFYYWKKRIEDGDSLPTPTGGFIPVKLNGKSCKLGSHISFPHQYEDIAYGIRRSGHLQPEA